MGCIVNEQVGKESGYDKVKISGEKVLYLNNENELILFDLLIGFNNVLWQLLNNIMEGLICFGKENEFELVMVEKWFVLNDKKIYIFMIWENVKWINGDLVMVGDFEYVWKWMFDLKKGVLFVFFGYFIEGGEVYNSGKGKKDDVKVMVKDD